jgi:alpha-tubulin suppressor-like RCC1 family protein
LGQCGLDFSIETQNTPALMMTNLSIKDVICGENHSLIIFEDELHSFGCNVFAIGYM